MNTKKLFCTILLVMLIPLYVAIAVISASRRVGENIATHKQQLNVIVENGVIADAVDYVPFLVPKSGDYQLKLDFTTVDPGFYTGIVVKDATGKAVLYNGFDTVVGYTDDVALPEGRATLELHYFADEQALRDFCAEYPIYSKSQLDGIESKLHFNDRIKTGNWYVSINLSVDEYVGSPAYVKIGVLVLSVVLFGLIMALFFKDHPTEEDERKVRLTSIGIRYSAFVFMIFVFELLTSVVLSLYISRETVEANNALVSMIMTVVIIDVFGFGLLYWVTKDVPVQKLEKKPMGIGKLLLILMMALGIAGVGSLLGAAVESIFSDNQNLDVTAIMLGTSLPLRAVVIGILAPILEELFFRKFLIDRLIKYGEFTSIFLSGLIFGLYHGNFQQFFYATFIGWLLAFVYVRTGNVRNTILIHMIINLGTSVITMSLLRKLIESGIAEIGDPAAATEALMADPGTFACAAVLALWVIFLIIIALIGLIVFIVQMAQKRFALRRLEDEPARGKILAEIFSNPYMWILFIVLLGQFIITYLPAMIK